uniref:J domain-containing protein n=1 Tax=viral metagenome TaxID=1070528 RepID=A0A6C0I8B2_9ZZZZ
MNYQEAKKILELGETYTDDDLKKNYKRLAMKYHPDRTTGSHDQFIKVQSAYEILSKKSPSQHGGDIMIEKILKSFVFNVPQFKRQTPGKRKVSITDREYFSRSQVKKDCNCPKGLCLNCAGCGFNINTFPPSVCMGCVGDGYLTVCNCFENVNPVDFDITISNNDKYFFQNSKAHCKFPISLKESLVGFEKIFKDPFDVDHPVTVKQIVRSGDGYSIKINDIELILVFDVKCPKRLPNEVIQAITHFTF